MIERATSVALSFGIHFGIMNSNMQNYTDEDLTKRLQELIVPLIHKRMLLISNPPKQ